MIKNSRENIKESFERIKQGQTGNYTPLKTRYTHLNTIGHGGIGRQRIITIGGLSAFGKSHTLRNIEEDIFNPVLNPTSREDTVLLKIDWEMTKEESILNRVKAKTGKSYKELMYEVPTQEVKDAFNEAYKELGAPYLYESFTTYSPKQFDEQVRAFCTEHKDKKQIVVTIDNANLIDKEGGDEQEALSNLETILIALKKDFHNITIIQLAQLNRSLKERTDLRDMFPKTSDFYNSSKIEHASDIQIIVHNPYLLGYMEYGVVNFERFKYLENYLIPKGKLHTFRTQGLVFWHYVKVRHKDDMKEFRDVFIEEIYSEDKSFSTPKNNREPLFD